MNQRILLPLVALALLAVGLGLFLNLESGTRDSEAGLTGSGQARETAELPPPAASGSQRSPRETTAAENEQRDSQQSTVVIPLKLELELISADGRLSSPNAKPSGSDASARLRGSAHTAAGSGVEGLIEFVAGPNQGRTLELDGTGRFGANDLYPGLSLVHITGRHVPGAMREVLLREGREAQLNVGFGRPAVVYGNVVDRQNNHIVGATVTMDGQATTTDEVGLFSFMRMASGKVPVFISKPGYADLRSVCNVTAGSKIEIGELKYTLERAATLRVSLPDRVGTGAPAQVLLSRPLEANYAGLERKYPWHLKNPTTLYAGETVSIEGLPPGRLRIQVYQSGAIVEPQARETTLIAGETRQEVFRMKPAETLSGVVMIGGKPAERALVQLEMPDLTGASVVDRGGALGRAQVELGLFSHAPSARQKVLTGADGRFELSANEALSSTRYLTARSSDGKFWAGVAVEKGQREVTLDLSARKLGRATLTVQTSTRFQALPVEYTVDGEPRATLLPAGEGLVIEGLPEGAWRYSARWGNEVIQSSTPIQVEGELDLFIPLPTGAVEGQSSKLRDALNQQGSKNSGRP